MMAIAFDATSNSGEQVGTAGYSWSHTCGGDDLVLIVGVSMSNINQRVDSIRYAGVPLQRLSRATIPGNVVVEQWYLVNPLSGANPVVVQILGTNVNLRSLAGAISLRGVDPENPVNVSNTAITGTDATSVSLTTTVDNCWIVDCVTKLYLSGDTLTVGGGQTERWNQSLATGGTLTFAAGSTKGPVSTGSNTMSWSTGSASNAAIAAVALTPIAARASIRGASTIRGAASIRI